MFVRSVTSLFLLVVLGGTASPSFAQAPSAAVDKARLNRIADAIENRLKGEVVGYSFEVAYRDDRRLTVARAGGVARRSPDSDPRAMRTDDRISIASVSKVMTAITLIKLLDEKKIALDSAIGSYLPSEMTAHPTVSAITFRELLTHESGLRDLTEPDYATLKKIVRTEIKPSDKIFKYQNCNFGLMRVLVPTIEGYMPPSNLDDYTKSYQYRLHTMKATQTRVFGPLGIKPPLCNNPAADKCLSYQFPSPVQEGTDWGDMTATNAYRGWVLSADEMSRVIRALLYTERLLTPTERETMLSGDLGIFHTTVDGLVEYDHAGQHPGNPIAGKLNLGEVNTFVAGYSNGISIAILVNSEIGNGDSIEKPIRTAITDDQREVQKQK